MAPPAMAPWCHVQSAKVVRRPPPVLEVRTPIAIAIWGKKHMNLTLPVTNTPENGCLEYDPFLFRQKA